MKMRAKLLTIPILLLLTVAIFSQTLITPIAGVEYPAIFVAPFPIEPPTTYEPGESFNVSIWTNYTAVELDDPEIWAYRFTLSWNPLVLNCTEVVNGNLIVNDTITATFSKGTIDNNAGTLGSTECYFDLTAGQPVPTTNGPGILANVTFKVVDWGDSDIAFESGTFLVDGDGDHIVDIDTMPTNIGHGYFCNVDPAPTHDIIVTNVSPNLTKVLAPTPVGINVTVLNNGTVPERFTVKVYYDTTGHDFLIGETLVDKLANKTSTLPLHFPWDTTYVEPGVEQGNHTIIAIAKPVTESKINPETNKDNNRNETASVIVYSPTIAVFPESTIDPEGETYSVTIYTDYNATEVVGSNDTWGYELTLSWNPLILEGANVANGGNMPQTDKWTGNNVTTIYNTTKKFVVADSETVQVNRTTMEKDVDYSIDYDAGKITFTTAPDYVLVEVEYLYKISLMPDANFTSGDFDNVNGKLKLTKNNVTTLVSGPGVLATVTFNVLDNIGESDITLGNETRLIGYGSDYYNITMPHRLKPGYFTNMGDASTNKIDMDDISITAYPTWSIPINVTVISQNVWAAPDFTVIVVYGASGVAEKQAGNHTVTGLGEGKKDTWSFTWYLTDVTLGEYTVSGKVVVPTGDHDPRNDEASDGTLLVKIPGDIDGNAIVNSDDFLKFGLAFGSTPAATNWNEQADFDKTNKVDSIDFLIFGLNFGESTTEY
jgi:hypothetical protein